MDGPPDLLAATSSRDLTYPNVYGFLGVCASPSYFRCIYKLAIMKILGNLPIKAFLNLLKVFNFTEK